MVFSDLINWKCETFLRGLGMLHVFCGCNFQGRYLVLSFSVLFMHRYSLSYCCFLPVQIGYTQQNSQQQLLHFIKTLDDSSSAFSATLPRCYSIASNSKSFYVNLYKHFIQTAPERPWLGCANAERACTGHVGLW